MGTKLRAHRTRALNPIKNISLKTKLQLKKLDPFSYKRLCISHSVKNSSKSKSYSLHAKYDQSTSLTQKKN